MTFGGKFTSCPRCGEEIEVDTVHSCTPSNPPPTPNAERPVWEQVIEDMRRRDNVGRARYGTPLQPFNGRDGLVDAYEEALDLAVYLKKCIVERDRAERDRKQVAIDDENERFRFAVANNASLDEVVRVDGKLDIVPRS